MKRSAWKACGLAIGFVGCGGGDDGGEPLHPDPDAGPVATTVMLDAYTSGDPIVLAYRDADGAWQDLPPNDEQSYRLRVHGAYEVIAVCGAAPDYQTEILFGMPADGPQTVFCFASSSGDDTPVATTRVTGNMTQPGSVTFRYSLDESMTGPWTFELDVPSGQPGDLFAFDADRVVLRRGLAPTAAIADIDLTTGHMLQKTAVLVDGREADDMLTTETYAFTENGSLTLRRSGSTVAGLPTALLEVSDFQFSYVSAATPTTHREHRVENQARVELLPRLQGITFDGTSVGWTTLPAEGDELSLSLWGLSGSVTVSATKGWREGRTQMAVPADLPANVPASAIPTDATRSASLSANDGERSSRVYEMALTPRQVSVGETRRRAALRKAKLRD